MNQPKQESDVVPGKQLGVVGLGVIVVIVASVLVANGLGACTSRGLGLAWLGPPPPPVPSEVNAMETTVFTTEAQGLEFHRRAAQFLASYGWVDREGQLVHVPIEVAFELYLARQGEQGGDR